MSTDIDPGDARVDLYFNALFRFFAKVEDQRQTTPDGCWIWPGAITATTGYGRALIEDRYIDAHRASWEFVHGEIPAGMDVCHRCDNRACVNFNHLFLGTRSVNMLDARDKGRLAGQKLRLADIPKIREASAGGRSAASIACDFGVDRRSISNVLNGVTWRGA